MGKITFGSKTSMDDKAAKVEKRYGATTGASKGGKSPPKATVSLKGTNPMKGKFSATVKQKF